MPLALDVTRWCSAGANVSASVSWLVRYPAGFDHHRLRRSQSRPAIKTKARAVWSWSGIEPGTDRERRSGGWSRWSLKGVKARLDRHSCPAARGGQVRFLNDQGD